LSDLERNVELWTRTNAEFTDAQARRKREQQEIAWGLWQVPERSLGILPDVRGLDVVELGRGTAYFSAWLARRGARVVGVDPTPAQLATARRCQAELGFEFPLIEAIGEAVPLPDASFGLALSDVPEDDGPAEERLHRPQFGMRRLEWPEGGVEFHLGHGDWIDLLRANAFEIERLAELQAPAEAEDPGYYGGVSAEWGRRWPAEEIWVAWKHGGRV
jgi:SAM-dependent methyltransferase